MEEELAAAAALLLYIKKKNDNNNTKKLRKRRAYKVRPLNRNRWQSGFYKTYFLRMKVIDPQQFFKYTRMDKKTFDSLLLQVTPLIKKKQLNNALAPEERLAMTLHYLSQGSSMQTIAWKYQVGKTTVHCIIQETCEAICAVLEPVCLRTPHATKEWQTIAKGFEDKWNFPHCLGALDGKHITVRAPKRSGSLYYNYLKTFSIVLLAACDANYRFTIVDIGGYGSLSDGATLKESVFGEKLAKNTFNFPPRAPITNDRSAIAFPYVFVADAAFPLSEHIFRPYPGTLLSEVQENFNKRLSRARRLIENAFGVLAARWRLLYQTINADVTLCELITKTCICLHNFLSNSSLYRPPGYVDTNDTNNGQWREELDRPLESISPRRLGAKHHLYSLRDALARYLNEEGKLL